MKKFKSINFANSLIKNKNANWNNLLNLLKILVIVTTCLKKDFKN